jgi:hypothetical protein
MRLFSILLLAVMSLSAAAQVESLIQFRGQNSEVIKVEKNINVVRPVAYDVPDTCYNDVPYQNYECNDVTRYRQACHWVPSSERCWTENDRVCRNVTRTRQECSNGPSRQVCTERPSRQVCTERPTREVCRTDSNGQQRCTTVGGGQSCQTVGGGQSCSTVPGERTCRNVSYTDQECSNVPRRRCETIPARNVCDNVPYTEQVCGNVTRYRQVPYACTRTEYRDETTPKKLTGQIQVHFQTNGLVDEFPLQVKVDAPNAKFETFATAVKLMKEPKEVFVILKKKAVKAEESEKEISLQGEIVLEVVEEKFVTPIFPTGFKNAAFDEDKSILSLGIEGSISAQGAVEAVFVAKPKVGKKKTIAEVKAAYPSQRASIKGSNLELNLAGLLQNDLAKKNELSLKLTAPLIVPGELLNSRKPNLEKSFTIEVRK